MQKLRCTCLVRLQEVEEVFYKYGKITRISIKPGEAGGMNAFCFVEFGHADEAYDAVKALDGREKLGKRLRVSAFPWVCPLPSAYAL